MNKYIDAEKLIAELTKMQFELNATYRKPQSDNIVRAISLEYDDILSLVDSLQQKQPEVDLEREIVENLGDDVWNDTSIRIQQVLIKVARHFWNKGYNARKEE